MRKRFNIIFLGLVFSVSLMASPDSLFVTANELYRNGKYEEAIELYKSISVAGFESPVLYYNWGNACFRSNKLGLARLYYEKTLKMNPNDEDALSNLNYLEGMLADRFDEVPVVFYRKWIRTIVRSLSSDSWTWLSIATFLISSISFVIYLFFRSSIVRRIGFYSALLLFIGSIIFLGAAWKQYDLLKNPDSGVITDLLVNARSAPHESGTELFVLHEGAKVYFEDKTGTWQEIRLSDGRKGWVLSGSVEPI